MKIEIKKIRLQNGLTQKQFGDIAGVSESFISYIEKGTKKMHAKNLIKIVKHFNLSKDYFFK